MARLFYGATGGDVIAQIDTASGGDYKPSTTTFSAYTTRTGSTQHTALQTVSGSATTTVSPSSTGRVMFYGQDAYTGSYWLQDNNNPTADRWEVFPSDMAERVVGGVSSVSFLGTSNATGAVSLPTPLLDDIGNVVAATPATNDALIWNGSNWVNAAVGATTLDSLSNVDAASPQQDDGIFFDSTVGRFVTGPTPDLPYAPENYEPDNFVPILVLEQGASVPAGTAAGTMIAYLAASGTVWGYGISLGGHGVAGSTSNVITLTAPVPAGTLIVVGTCADAVGGTLATWTVTDSKSNTWSLVTRHIQASTSQTAMHYCTVTTDLAVGDTITVASGATRTQIASAAATVTGAAATSRLDATATNGSSGVVTSLSVGPTPTTAQTDEIAFAVFGFNSSGKTFTPSNGYALAVNPVPTSASTTSQRGVALVYKILTTTTSVTASGELSVAESFTAIAGTFKKA